MQPPRPHRRGSTSRLRWLLTMFTAVALAFVVTHHPSGSSDGRGRELGEEDLLPGGGAADGTGSRGTGGARGVSAAGTGAADGSLAASTGGGVVVGGGDSISGEADPESAQLEGRAACVARATTMPAPVHGWVSKAGALPMRLLDGPQTPARHQAYFRWRDSGNQSLLTQEVVVDGKPERVGSAPPLFPYCRVLVNHAYRTMYLKAPKTGSTSLLTLLGTCTGAPTDKATCFQPLKPMASKEQYEQLYRDYFVFAVVRNPWMRAVSSYRMLLRYMRRTCASLVGNWNSMCRDLNQLARLHNTHPQECTRAKQQGEGFAMHHLIAQAPCLVADGGGWAADYVVRMEHLQGDMREVLKQMDGRRGGDAPALDVEELLGQLTNVNRVHVACRGGLTAQPAAASRRRSLLGRPLDDGGDGAVAAKPLPDWLEASESYCHDAQYYLGQHSGCFDALRAYYAHDVSLFGLPRCDDPPA